MADAQQDLIDSIARHAFNEVEQEEDKRALATMFKDPFYVDYAELETRMMATVMGIDFAVDPDRIIIQQVLYGHMTPDIEYVPPRESEVEKWCPPLKHAKPLGVTTFSNGHFSKLMELRALLLGTPRPGGEMTARIGLVLCASKGFDWRQPSELKPQHITHLVMLELHNSNIKELKKDLALFAVQAAKYYETNAIAVWHRLRSLMDNEPPSVGRFFVQEALMGLIGSWKKNGVTARDQAKKHLFALAYGHNPHPGPLEELDRLTFKDAVQHMEIVLHNHDGVPNKNGDAFHIEPKQWAVFKQCCLDAFYKENLISRGRQTLRERIYNSMDLGRLDDDPERFAPVEQYTRYTKEYIGQWPTVPIGVELPLHEKLFRPKEKRMTVTHPAVRRYENFTIQSHGADCLHQNLEERMQEARNRIESPMDRRRELEKRYGAQARSYSPATQAFLDAQRKSRPKELVDKAVQQNEAALVEEKHKADKQVGTMFKPRHCEVCGHANGCHHPREDAPPEVKCQHLFLTRVFGTVAVELGATEQELKDKAIYACRDCAKLILRVPKTNAT